MHDARRHDSGRNDNPGAELNEERIGRTGRGDAPDEERQSMVFWDEGAHRRGCRERVYTHVNGDAGECTRYNAGIGTYPGR